MSTIRQQTRGVPQLGKRVYVDPAATIIGDVQLGDGSSVWFGTVVRGDVDVIRIGARVNLQDQTMVHVTGGRHATTIEDDVTVGHRATLHGCTVRRRVLIGMGAVVLDGAEIGAEAMIAAGATRIGASASVAIVRGGAGGSGY